MSRFRASASVVALARSASFAAAKLVSATRSSKHYLRLLVRERPLLAGLVFAALFVPIMAIVNVARGVPVALPDMLKLVVISIPAGLIWGVATSSLTARAENRDAR